MRWRVSRCCAARASPSRRAILQGRCASSCLFRRAAAAPTFSRALSRKSSPKRGYVSSRAAVSGASSVVVQKQWNLNHPVRGWEFAALWSDDPDASWCSCGAGSLTTAVLSSRNPVHSTGWSIALPTLSGMDSKVSDDGCDARRTVRKCLRCSGLFGTVTQATLNIGHHRADLAHDFLEPFGTDSELVAPVAALCVLTQIDAIAVPLSALFRFV